MQFTDALFLARFSDEAIAAVGPAGMTAYLLISICLGTTAYTSTLVAQYYGAKQTNRVSIAVWQGIYFGAGSGVAMAGLAPFGNLLFNWIDHAPLVKQYEIIYFKISCLGIPAVLVANAISGFFTGLGRTRTVMTVQLAGILTNIFLAYGLIFGKWGMPEWGMAGAATAMVFSQFLTTVIYIFIFLRKKFRSEFATWSGKGWNQEMIKRLIRFGLPNGFRMVMEVLAWTVFLFFMGRIGAQELAATNIAWRINGLAFFPIIGLAAAIQTLVGQTQGRRETQSSVHITMQGLFIAQCWMVAAGLIFVIFPKPLYYLFEGTRTADQSIVQMGTILLRFVAAYSLLDAFNFVIVGALMAAGDTRWTFYASFVLHGIFIIGLWICDYLKIGFYAEWTVATVFVMVLALAWWYRFRTGVWKTIKVIV